MNRSQDKTILCHITFKLLLLLSGKLKPRILNLAWPSCFKTARRRCISHKCGGTIKINGQAGQKKEEAAKKWGFIKSTGGELKAFNPILNTINLIYAFNGLHFMVFSKGCRLNQNFMNKFPMKIKRAEIIMKLWLITEDVVLIRIQLSMSEHCWISPRCPRGFPGTGYFRKVYRSLQVRVRVIFWSIYSSKSCRKSGLISLSIYRIHIKRIFIFFNFITNIDICKYKLNNIFEFYKYNFECT